MFIGDISNAALKTKYLISDDVMFAETVYKRLGIASGIPNAATLSMFFKILISVAFNVHVSHCVLSFLIDPYEAISVIIKLSTSSRLSLMPCRKSCISFLLL